MTNSEMVRRIYDSLQQRDAASVLAAFDPSLEFRLAEGHPYQPSGEPWFGKDAVAQNFFMRSAPDWDDWKAAIEELHEMGEVAVVEGRYSGIFKHTGNAMDLQFCHIWKFKDHQVTSFHQYVDTARLQKIMEYGEKTK